MISQSWNAFAYKSFHAWYFSATQFECYFIIWYVEKKRNKEKASWHFWVMILIVIESFLVKYENNAQLFEPYIFLQSHLICMYVCDVFLF